MQKLYKYSRRYGLEINASKIKVMIVDRVNNNNSGSTIVAGYEVVHRFEYLGSIVTNIGDCEPEIHSYMETHVNYS